MAGREGPPRADGADWHRVVTKRVTGSHRILQRSGWPDYSFAFHDNDEIGPVMLSKMGKKTGLTPGDL
jgi:hypothetical protein